MNRANGEFSTLSACRDLPAEGSRRGVQQLVSRAVVAWFDGNRAQMEDLLRKAMTGRPQSALSALSFMLAGSQPNHAATLLRWSPSTNRAMVRQIDGFCRQRRYPVALSLAEGLVLNCTDHPDAKARVCGIRLAMGEHAAALADAKELVHRFPSSPIAWRSLASVAMGVGDRETARRAALQLLSLHRDPNIPKRGDDISLCARIMVQAGEFEEARRLAEIAERATAADPSESAIHRARVARVMGDAAWAVRILEESVGTGPGDAETFAELGDALRDLGHYGQAVEMARRALRIVPHNKAALRCLAHALQRKGCRLAALEAFQHLTELDPGDQDAIYGLEAVVEGGSGGPESHDFEIISDADRSLAFWAQGRRLRLQGRPREAIVQLGRAFSLNSSLIEPVEELGWCFLEIARPERARAAFEMVLHQGGGSQAEAGFVEAESFTLALNAPVNPRAPNCDAERMIGYCFEMMSIAGPSIFTDPVDPNAESILFTAGMLSIAGQRVQAERLSRVAVDRSPHHPVLRLLEVCCLINLERYAEALDGLQLLIDAGWTTGDVHHLIALCANANNDYATAAQHWILAMQLVPHLADFAAYLGDVKLVQGDTKGAIAAFREAVRRMPSFALAHQNYAARYDHTKYEMSGLEFDFPDNYLLADGYNRSGEKNVHVGNTEQSNKLFGAAIIANRQLGSNFRLCRDLAEEVGVSTDRVRILPHEWVIQIGHMAMLDTWLKIGHLGWRSPAPAILLAPRDRVVNQTYLDCWRPFFAVVETPSLIRRLEPLQRVVGECFNGWVGEDGRAEAFTDVGARAYVAWDRDKRSPLINVSSELCQRGRAALNSMGMEKDAWFVAIHIRARGFHGEGSGSSQDHRNANITDYLGAIEMVTARGGWVIRMGDRSMPPLPDLPRVIDYARSPIKSDWMDVFLCGNARCYLGTTSGLANVAISFGTPCVLVNCLSNYAQLWPGNVCFTWRPYWSVREERYLSLEEILAEPVRGNTFSANILSSNGIIPRNNEAEDIRQALAEMLDISEGQAFPEEPESVLLWREAAKTSFFFGNARPARYFAERTRSMFFP